MLLIGSYLRQHTQSNALISSEPVRNEMHKEINSHTTHTVCQATPATHEQHVDWYFDHSSQPDDIHTYGQQQRQGRAESEEGQVVVNRHPIRLGLRGIHEFINHARLVFTCSFDALSGVTWQSQLGVVSVVSSPRPRMTKYIDLSVMLGCMCEDYIIYI